MENAVIKNVTVNIPSTALKPKGKDVLIQNVRHVENLKIISEEGKKPKITLQNSRITRENGE